MAEWFGLSEREGNWVRSRKAGNEEDGYSEALLGVDEEGGFPLRVRASEYEVGVLEAEDGEWVGDVGSVGRERSGPVGVGPDDAPLKGWPSVGV